MTKIAIESKPGAGAGYALERHAQNLYSRPGLNLVGVVELRHVERTQPAPDEDKEPAVKVRISQLEIANPEQEDTIRQAMSALYRQRTAAGTITEDGDVQLAESTIKMTGGLLDAIEAARMRVAVEHWAAAGRRALGIEAITTTEMRHELDAIVSGLESVLRPDGGEPA